MKYISRRILNINKKGEEVESSDIDFFDIDSPLILLGEPGAGKSELLRFAKERLGAKLYNASSIEGGVSLDDSEKTIIIDGVDEITAYEVGTPINKILSKLPDTKKFILSCRAADWQDTVNLRIINQRWKQQPVVGKILPLNKEEIVEFVNANGEGQDGEEFLNEAMQRDVIDLLSNPQNLLLLLKAVENEGWPDSRWKLFENASLQLVKEDNEIHASIYKTRPPNEKLIEASGFIFSQLLLAGKSGVLIGQAGNNEFPNFSEFVSESLSEDTIKLALSTKLFRPIGKNLLEPCHRTMSEFLAAKWLANALNNKLSIRRLEAEFPK